MRFSYLVVHWDGALILSYRDNTQLSGIKNIGTGTALEYRENGKPPVVGGQVGGANAAVGQEV